MSKHDESAFPIPSVPLPDGAVQLGIRGMSLWDYFTAHALNGLCANANIKPEVLYAVAAADLADAMMAEREKRRAK